MFFSSHSHIWLWRLVWNSRRDFLKTYFESYVPCCFSLGFTFVYSFSEILRITWFSAMSRTSRYLTSLHIILQFHRKKMQTRGERLQLCRTQVPVLSHSIIWLFAHAEYLTPPEGCCRSVALNIQQQDSASLCSATRCPIHGRAPIQFNDSF